MVRRVGGELGPAGVDGLEGRGDAQGQPGRADGRLVGPKQVGQLGIGEAEPLQSPPFGPGERPEGGVAVGRPPLVHRDPGRADLLDLGQEPRVDAAAPGHLVDAQAPAERLFDLEDPVGAGHRDPIEERLVVEGPERCLGRVGVEAVATLLQRAHRLLQGLAEGPPDRHHLADRLHLRAQLRLGAGELLEGEARDLGHDVVDGRLEAGRGGAGDVVRDLGKLVADREPRRDLGDREPGRLGREGRRARHARVHLDDDPAPVPRIDGELDVRPTGLDPDPAEARERVIAHRLVLDVGQGLGRRHGDRVPGVHPHRVEVLDRAHDDAVVGAVAHDLELVLLPPDDRTLDEDLAHRAGVDTRLGQRGQRVGVGGDPRSRAAEDEARPDDHREPDPACDLQRLGDRVGEARFWDLEADVPHRPLEQLAVLRRRDRLGPGPDHFHAEPLEHAGACERHGQVEGRLAAERRQQGVGALALDDRLEHRRVERLDVGAVGRGGVGHDRRRVGVDEDDPVALLAQHPAGLGARVVELARLADDDGPGPDDQDRLDVLAAGHAQIPPPGTPERISDSNSPNR